MSEKSAESYRGYKRSRKIEKMELSPEPAQEKQEKQEPKKVKTKWIVIEDTATKKCSACNGELRGWAYHQKFKFCPFCGAQNLS